MSSSSSAAATAIANSSSNNLTPSSSRKRDLIDRIRYPNPIPLPPYPPKLINISTDPARYSDPHFADRLAQQHPLPVLVDAHAGMPIDLASFQDLWEGDYSEISLPAGQALPEPDSLHEDDAFLLSDFSAALPGQVGSATAMTSLSSQPTAALQASIAAATQQRHSQALGPGSKTTLTADEVTWLRRTEYLSAEQKRKQSNANARPKAVDTIDSSRDAQILRIRQTFEQANKPLEHLRHPTKKGVKAVQAFDFLPDPETWATDYQVVRFTDHPGKIVNGRPVEDPRLDVALLRPVAEAGGRHRVSFYLCSGEELPDDISAPIKPSSAPDADVDGAKRIRKRRRTGRFPVPKELDDPSLGRGDDTQVGDGSPSRNEHATAYRWTRDYETTDQALSSYNHVVLVLDDGIPDPDPDADVDPITGARKQKQEEDDDLFGGDDDELPDGTNAFDDVETTLPPQSLSERIKRARVQANGKGKDKQSTDVGSSSTPRRNAKAYYHKIAMRYTLRKRRERKNERKGEYEGKWHGIALSHRSMTEREILKRLHARKAVDDLPELDPYESSEGEEEQDAEGEDAETFAGDGDKAVADSAAGREDEDGAAEDEGKERDEAKEDEEAERRRRDRAFSSSSAGSQTQLGSVEKIQRQDDGKLQEGGERDGKEEEDGIEEGRDGGKGDVKSRRETSSDSEGSGDGGDDEDDDEEEDGESLDGDEELAELQAEAKGAGDDVEEEENDDDDDGSGGRRRRRARNTAPVTDPDEVEGKASEPMEVDQDDAVEEEEEEEEEEDE
ncbi:Paf1-domain-containing protein [Violaceomyces palustris]|uniref:Paf1-domain-containing protein n=1 Tax=Violaceomyces palustris TaxID=1673888 RepID=A0ACD0NQR3_9BASI|nr:Paf1-domain-containing protein [Violaceomyces palustris]